VPLPPSRRVRKLGPRRSSAFCRGHVFATSRVGFVNSIALQIRWFGVRSSLRTLRARQSCLRCSYTANWGPATRSCITDLDPADPSTLASAESVAAEVRHPNHRAHRSMYGQACALLLASLTRLRTWVESGIWRGQAERLRVREASAACGARNRFSLQAGEFSRAGRVYAPHGFQNAGSVSTARRECP
jgi:hypothetical protein